MFTHPALLKQLKLAAALTRQAGATDWARRLVTSADAVRKHGWTEKGFEAYQSLFQGDGNFDSLSFGIEHSRRLGGPEGIASANQELSELRQELKIQASLGLRDTPAPGTWRPRSPDLG
jgi:hypothetical protein